MSQETQFRNALFGGFHKEDVLNYIRSLQTEVGQLRERLEEKDAEAPALREQLALLEEEVSVQQVRNREFVQINDDYARRILSVSQERDDFETKLKNLEADCEKLKDVEGQVGALILDALLYSEKIIGSAKAVSSTVAQNAKESIRSSALGVDEIGGDINRFSAEFSDTLASLSAKINSLSADLTNVAEQLDAPPEDEEQFEFGESGNLVLRAIKKTKEEAEAAAETEAEPESEPELQAAPEAQAGEESAEQPMQAVELADALSFLMCQLDEEASKVAAADEAPAEESSAEESFTAETAAAESPSDGFTSLRGR